ncbi:MAG: TIM44-like domain-containing protein [Motiliproteus sp.]|nr:TIM44-like domain-containing protein [Motiliproteus sp.]MCW9051036.1 TIM44-like domain-containing protein [Motiliproteus sp.]
MMRILTICCALLVGFTFSADYAEAKRFGGGGSFGKMFSTPKKAAPRPAPSKNATQPSSNQTTTTAAKPKPGMGGLMGGLLMGGLLGALFFGGAFEGIQIMDILIIAVIAFVLFRFLSRMKQPQQKPQYAGNYHQPEEQEQQSQQRTAPEPQASGFEPTPLMSSSLSEANLELPAWFDKESFLAGARDHFVHLQDAWGRNDLEEIRTYCEADFYQLLVDERAKLDSGNLDNEVVSVMVELLGFNELDNRAELSINFYGWMREGTGEQTTEFNEIWHLNRDTTKAEADWFIVGIEQP